MMRCYYPDQRNYFFALGNDGYRIGHSLKDMVLQCMFERSQCRDDDFVLFNFPTLINCYTFKRGREESTILSGFGASLSMTMYLEPDDPAIRQIYRSRILIENNKGMRVPIVPPNIVAAITNAGYDVFPGYFTSIGFDITENIRLSEPHSECRTTASVPLKGNVAYSFVECRNMLVHEILMDECGCYLTGFVSNCVDNLYFPAKFSQMNCLHATREL